MSSRRKRSQTSTWTVQPKTDMLVMRCVALVRVVPTRNAWGWATGPPMLHMYVIRLLFEPRRPSTSSVRDYFL